VTATAIIAAIGNGAAFKKGRGFSAWLGIVPGEYTTGGKQKLLGISKRGNSIAIGLTLAALLARAVSSAFFGVVQTNVVTFAALTLLLAAVAAIAAYLRARRATKWIPWWP
jgi:transposase